MVLKKDFKKKYGRKYFKRKLVNTRKPMFRMGKSYGLKAEPFPSRLHTRAVYSYVDYRSTEGKASDPTGNGNLSNQVVFNLMSIYQPLLGGGDTTVRGWTEFDDLYNKYIVKGCKVEVSFDDPSQDGGICYVSLCQGIGMSSRTHKEIIDVPTTYTSALNNTGSQRKKFKLYVRPWTLIGISKLEYMTNSDKYASIFNGNPDYQAIMRCGTVANNVDLQNNVTMTMSVKLTYYFMAYNRKGMATSAS